MSKRRLKAKEEAARRERAALDEAERLASTEFFRATDICQVLGIDGAILSKLQKFYDFPAAISAIRENGFICRVWDPDTVRAWAAKQVNQDAIKEVRDFLESVSKEARHGVA